MDYIVNIHLYSKIVVEWFRRFRSVKKTQVQTFALFLTIYQYNCRFNNTNYVVFFGL